MLLKVRGCFDNSFCVFLQSFTFLEKQQILCKWSCRNRQEKEIPELRYGLSKPPLEVVLKHTGHNKPCFLLCLMDFWCLFRFHAHEKPYFGVVYPGLWKLVGY